MKFVIISLLLQLLNFFSGSSLKLFRIPKSSNLLRFSSESSENEETLLTTTSAISNDVLSSSNLQLDYEIAEEDVSQRSNKIIAVLSCLLGCGIFFFQQTQPVSGIALLKAMEKDSIPIKQALCNGKPTLVEFYADWCESCKSLAPTMRALELKYRNNLNFVTINGVDPTNAAVVGRFGVDGIPHIAFVSKDSLVKTALVGAVPRKILSEEIDALLLGKDPLPYEGYDAFEDSGSRFPFQNNKESFCSTVVSANN